MRQNEAKRGKMRSTQGEIRANTGQKQGKNRSEEATGVKNCSKSAKMSENERKWAKMGENEAK